MSRLILASGSPRRREILQRAGFDFDVIATDTDESLEPNLPPGELASALALKKAKAAARLAEKNSVVVAADTVVFLDETILGKPPDAAGALEMLRSLSGRWHEVYTGIAIVKGGCEQTDFELTRVKFRELDESEIRSYVGTGSPFDKAGGYGIQDKGALFVERIDGDYYNVMGLPVCKLATILKRNYGIVVL